MSTEKYSFVNNIFDTLIAVWLVKGYKGLAEYIGVPYQTLMAWKKRDSIGDYSPFMDKGISKTWLETGEGSMFRAVDIAEQPTIPEMIEGLVLSPRDKRIMMEMLKMDEAEKDQLAKELTLQNMEKGRY